MGHHSMQLFYIPDALPEKRHKRLVSPSGIEPEIFYILGECVNHKLLSHY